MFIQILQKRGVRKIYLESKCIFLKKKIAAASNDMGITTTIFPFENCTKAEQNVMMLQKQETKLIYQMIDWMLLIII